MEKCLKALHAIKVARGSRQPFVTFRQTIEKDVVKTWLHQPKGMLERGLLDFDKYFVEEFSEKGKIDAMGNRIGETNLPSLLSECTDFIEEESLLQLNLRLLGVSCIHSPTKYHCEIAGEGIEYSWGNAKVKYRRMRVRDKKNPDMFHMEVLKCLSRDYLTKERIGETNSPSLL